MSVTDDFDVKFYDGQPVPLEILETFFKQGFLDTFGGWLRFLYDSDGMFGSSGFGIQADGNDKVALSISGNAPKFFVDGFGELMRLQSFAVGTDPRQSVQFENAAVTYYLGVEVASYPAAPATSQPLDINLNTLKPEYRLYKKTIGRMGHPTSVTLNGDGTLTLRIDDILLDPTRSHAGRKCKVWLKTPASSDYAIAVQELTVAFSGGQNSVTTPNTAAKAFGQASPSAVTTDYFVLIEGITVTRDRNLSTSRRINLTGTITITGTNNDNLNAAGGALLTELRAGDRISIYGKVRTVVRVLSNTDATLDRPVVMEPEPTNITTIRGGVYYIGSITGAGSGSPINPATFVDGQNLIQFSLSDFASVLRKDSHGDTKVEVTADASDSNERQVSIKDAAGVIRRAFIENGADKYFSSGTDDYHLLGEHSVGGSSQKVRFYLYDGADLFITVNAIWDQAALAWDPDNAGDPAMGLSISDRDFYLVSKTVTADNFTWEASFNLRIGSGTYWQVQALKNAIPGLVENHPVFHVGDAGADFNLIGQWGNDTEGNGAIRAYMKKVGTYKGLTFTVNAKYNGTTWDKDVNGNASARLRLTIDATGEVSFAVEYENGGADGFAEGSWANMLTLDKSSNATFAQTDVKAPTNLWATLFRPYGNADGFRALSRVANNIDGAIAHNLESLNTLSQGVSRYLNLPNASGTPQGWMNHKGGMACNATYFREEFITSVLDTTNGAWKFKDISGTGGTVERSAVTGKQRGGWVRIATDGGTNDAVELHLNHLTFVASLRPIVRARVSGDSITIENTIVEVGLFADDGSENMGEDGIYLRLDPAVSLNWYLVCNDSSGETTDSTGIAGSASGGAPYPGSNMTFELVVEGTNSVKAFLNGATSSGSTGGAEVTANIPTGELKLGIRTKEVVTSVGKSAFVDFFEVWQDRE
jgi:hypothetical protein